MTDENILSMATEFLKANGCDDSRATEVEYQGDDRYNIHFDFPTSGGGTKSSEWSVSIVELMATLWLHK